MTVIVGAGAVGGLLAGLLDRAGHDVAVVARSETGRALAEQGLHVESAQFGSWVSRPELLDTVPRGESMILAVKAPALPEAVDALAPSRPAHVLALQNGVEHADLLRRALPGTTVTAASIYVGAAREGRYRFRHETSFVRLLLAEVDRGLPTITALAEAGATVETAADEATALWRKFLFLAPMALLTSFWQAPLGEARDRDRALSEQVAAEIARIATAAGVAATADDVLAPLDGMPAHMRSSLQRDLEAGDPGELDAIGGACLRLAHDAGFAVPRVQEMVEALRARLAAAQA